MTLQFNGAFPTATARAARVARKRGTKLFRVMFLVIRAALTGRDSVHTVGVFAKRSGAAGALDARIVGLVADRSGPLERSIEVETFLRCLFVAEAETVAARTGLSSAANFRIATSRTDAVKIGGGVRPAERFAPRRGELSADVLVSAAIQALAGATSAGGAGAFVAGGQLTLEVS